MNDLISRKEALKALREIFTRGNGLRPATVDMINAIKFLPSAEPKIIHCGECVFAEVADSEEDVQDGYVCQFHPGSIWFSGSFCSWAKAKMGVTECY